MTDRRTGNFNFDETSLQRVRTLTLEQNREYQECASISLTEVRHMDWKWMLYLNSNTLIGKGHEAVPEAAFAAANRRLKEFRGEPMFPGGPRAIK